MVVARVSERGLSADELQVIRDGLAAGRKPRVQFTEAAGQVAGQIGQVVGLEDPSVADEWVVVRFGRDELPFSPGDLRVAPKGAAARKAAPDKAVTPEPAVPSGPEFVLDRPAAARSGRSAAGAAGAVGRSAGGGAGGSGAAGGGGSAPPAAANGSVQGGRPQAAVDVVSRVDEAAGVSRSSGGSGASGRANGQDGVGAPAPRKGGDDVTAPAGPRKAAGRAAKTKAPAGLTVTLAYGEGEWTVAAAQGAKVLAKPYVIRPAEALRMVSLVDVPGVQEAVEQILSAERAEAEQQAQRLRAELAEVEARLAELGEAP